MNRQKLLIKDACKRQIDIFSSCIRVRYMAALHWPIKMSKKDDTNLVNNTLYKFGQVHKPTYNIPTL